jgi:hypothetical protein
VKSLLDTYKENVGRRPLFAEIIDIDFYDGPTEALCQLVESNQWVICSLVYADIERGIRIFTLIEITDRSLSKFKQILEKRSSNKTGFYQDIKAQVKGEYDGYIGKVFLFKCDWLDATEYKVVEMPLEHLEYFKDIEDVLGQNEESKARWLSYFPT